MRRLVILLIGLSILAACGSESEQTRSSEAGLPPSESNALAQTLALNSAVEKGVATADVSAPSGGERAAAAPISVSADDRRQAEVEATLAKYQAAMESRDLPALEAIWSMTVVEKSLLSQAWAVCDAINLEIMPGEVTLVGDRASAEFEQRMEFRCPNSSQTTRSSLTAELSRAPGGGWRIENIADRSASRFSRSAGFSPRQQARTDDPRELAALRTLATYEVALEGCDIDRLSRVWIMTPLERQMLNGVCVQNRRLRVSITSPEVSIVDGQVRVDFTHQIDFSGGRGAQSATQLTALLVEREGGDWAIWKMRTTN